MKRVGRLEGNKITPGSIVIQDDSGNDLLRVDQTEQNNTLNLQGTDARLVVPAGTDQF